MSIAPKASTPETSVLLDPASPNPLLKGKFTIQETRNLNQMHKDEVLDIISTKEKIQAVAEWIIVNVSSEKSRCQTHALLGTIQKLLPVPGNEISQLLIHQQNFPNLHPTLKDFRKVFDQKILEAFEESFRSGLPFGPLMKELDELKGLPEELRVIGFSSDVSYQNAVKYNHFCKDFLQPHLVFSFIKGKGFEFEPLNGLDLHYSEHFVQRCMERLGDYSLTPDKLYNELFIEYPDLPFELMTDQDRETYAINKAKMTELVQSIYSRNKEYLTKVLETILAREQSGNLIFGTCANHLKSAYKIAKFSKFADGSLTHVCTFQEEDRFVSKQPMPCFVSHSQYYSRNGDLGNAGHYEVAIPVTSAVRAVLDQGIDFNGRHYVQDGTGRWVFREHQRDQISSTFTTEDESLSSIRSRAIQFLNKGNEPTEEYADVITTEPTQDGGLRVTLFTTKGSEKIVRLPPERPIAKAPAPVTQEKNSCNIM
jgi:hypothetical protein